MAVCRCASGLARLEQAAIAGVLTPDAERAQSRVQAFVARLDATSLCSAEIRGLADRKTRLARAFAEPAILTPDKTETRAAAIRTLPQMQVGDAEDAAQMFSTLMGDVVEPRRDFIVGNASRVANLDV